MLCEQCKDEEVVGVYGFMPSFGQLQGEIKKSLGRECLDIAFGSQPYSGAPYSLGDSLRYDGVIRRIGES